MLPAQVMASVTIYNALVTAFLGAANKDDVTAIIAPSVLATAALGLNGGDYGTVTVGIFSFFTAKGWEVRRQSPQQLALPQSLRWLYKDQATMRMASCNVTERRSSVATARVTLRPVQMYPCAHAHRAISDGFQ